MERNNGFVRLATLGPIGYLPAPGTMGTLVTLPLAYGLALLRMPMGWHLAIVVGVTFLSFRIIGRALEQFKLRDPAEIIFDEVVGCLVTFVGIPASPLAFFVGFAAFRFFDILKPLGIRKCEMLYGPLGVVMDDIFAGIFANLVVRLVMHYL